MCGIVGLRSYFNEPVSNLVPKALLSLQHRGQLSAGISTYNSRRPQLLKTHKGNGGVNSVFELDDKAKSEALKARLGGDVAIGHVRYATSGATGVENAQPFTREHIVKSKYFSFAFNGNISNYEALRDELLKGDEHHLASDTDTEIILHLMAHQLQHGKPLIEAIEGLMNKIEGGYSLVLLDAKGNLAIARDPLGIRPLCGVYEAGTLAVASESVALQSLGFDPKKIRPITPGEIIVAGREKLHFNGVKTLEPVNSKSRHCFMEAVYFSSVASNFEEFPVARVRQNLGRELAKIENQEADIVVPVPDSGRTVATSLASELGLPCLDGLICNRYVGRSFIKDEGRKAAVQAKFQALPSVLEGQRVLLVDDSIVRSTTMRVIVQKLRDAGAKEIHVRIGCPPIKHPCRYGIDIKSSDELFAAQFESDRAKELGADSLRYLEAGAVKRAMGNCGLCMACVDGCYPV